MPQLRRDPIISNRWVIIAVERAKRPNDFKHGKVIPVEKGPCPFCEGNEKLTPPEVDADRPKSSSPDAPGWLTRTVPNKYPALEDGPEITKAGAGMFEAMKGIGKHEVIIEGPDHSLQLADLDVEQIKKVINAYKRRSLKLQEDKRFKYVLIFKNYGVAAGASLEHSHTQLISLPIVPRRVLEELSSARDYFNSNKKCVFCDILEQELKAKQRDVCENEDFFAFCPFASRFPFEVSIMPKKHQAYFTDITPSQVDSFARILKDVLTKIKKVLKDPSYNFIIHTNSFDAKAEEYYHWHVELMPKLSKTAGFEWGTGFYINPMPPEEAGKYLKSS